MPKEQREKQSSRQRPISCKFCRVRKLRCSRESPCSSCVSRGIPCTLDQPEPQSPSSTNSPDSEVITQLRQIKEILEERALVSQVVLKPNDEHVPKNIDCKQACPYASELGGQIQGLARDFSWLDNVFVTDGFSVRLQTNQYWMGF
jgi:hypothetical protein